MMKIQKFNLVKALATVIFFSVVIVFAACKGRQGKSARNERKSLITEVMRETPKMTIHAAAFMGDMTEVKKHIKAGTNLNEKDEYGSTPLIIAATFDKTAIAEALIEGGADLGIRNNEGSTALHVAAFFCRTEIVKALLSKGADKTLTNNYGSTAFESVSGSFDEVKPIYVQMNKDLGPFGLKLDYDYLESTRPLIAELLK